MNQFKMLKKFEPIFKHFCPSHRQKDSDIGRALNRRAVASVHYLNFSLPLRAEATL
jgi:hypothetical protein